MSATIYMWKEPHRGYYYDEQELGLEPEHRNARIFLRAYQLRAPQNYRGGNMQAYQNWRVAWVIECLAHLPPTDYKVPEIIALKTDVARYENALNLGFRLRKLL